MKRPSCRLHLLRSLFGSVVLIVIIFKLMPTSRWSHPYKIEGSWTAKDSLKGNQVPLCVHPKLQLWHPALKSFFLKQEKPLQCAKDSNWVHVKNGKICMSSEATKKHGKITCDYTPYYRGGNDFDIVAGKVVKDIKEGTNLDSDFFGVFCQGADAQNYSNIHASIAYKKDVHSRSVKAHLPDNSMGVNVLIVGLDSLSRMTWQRNLPKTHDYFAHELGGVVLEGYNIVGDGTPQALLPLLTGKTEPELPEARRGKPNAKTVDGHPWAWKDFAKAGYATQFNEDSTSIGAFTYRMLGFKDQPVDHYMRTFYRKAEQVYNKHEPLCLGSEPRHRVMLNYVRDFFNMYKGKPKWSFSFHGELTHDSNTNVQIADHDIKQFLISLKEEGQLNSTIVILMSDHGARFEAVRQTMQGKYEERMPYVGVLLPERFKNVYPVAFKNLHSNAHRLTTPFDIHETLMDVLHYDGSRVGNRTNRGISLFDEIPLDRRCSDAGIENHWCACLKWKKVSPSDKSVLKSVSALLATMNEITAPERKLCEELRLVEIKSALIYTPQQDLVKFKGTKDRDGFVPDLTDNMIVTEVSYQITIVTSPGEGMFETTVKMEKDSVHVNDKEISRINMYGDQPHCVSARLPHLRPYCYCKQQQH